MERDIELKINDMEHDIKDIERRINKIEKMQNDISNLTLSVNELSINMKYMLEEQIKLSDKIVKIEIEPVENVKYYKKLVVGCILTTIVSAIICALITLLT